MILTPRDLMEDGWHASLLAFVWPPFLRRLLVSRWLRWAVATAILAALAYHLAVVQACYAGASLCYWRV